MPLSLLPLLCLILSGCGLLRPQVVDIDRAALSDGLGFRTDGRGQLAQLGYHVTPSETPVAVRAAMDRLHPGNPYTDAQVETRGPRLLYKLTRIVDGLEIASIFQSDGTLVSEELEIPEDQVPASVRETIAERISNAALPRYDEVRDGLGEVRAYHVRLRLKTHRYKLVLSREGTMLQALLEIPAAVEVPVAPPTS
ncbi:MAG: hypothetical protein P8N09_10690 [Planctomycetota bacterium]|nr:hypothetical protein [Planctomycetota bacterium]